MGKGWISHEFTKSKDPNSIFGEEANNIDLGSMLFLTPPQHSDSWFLHKQEKKPPAPTNLDLKLTVTVTHSQLLLH